MVSFLLFFLVYPFIQKLMPNLATLLEFFLLGVFAAVAYAVISNRYLFVIALSLLTFGTGSTIAAHIYYFGPLLLMGVFCSIVFLCLAIVFILKEVLSQRNVNFDCISGALNGYLLLGLFFGLTYQAVELIWPGSFVSSGHHFMQAVVPGQFRELKEFFYFSLVTLTTLGYGDITPAGGPAISIATLEAVLGQFYMVVLVARLVALHAAKLK